MNFTKFLMVISAVLILTNNLSYAQEVNVDATHTEENEKQHKDINLNELNLRDDQKITIQGLKNDMRYKADMLRHQMNELQREYEERLTSVLDDEQREKYMKMKSEVMEEINNN